MGSLLIWLFYFVSLYAFIPGLLSRIFGYRATKRGTSDHHIALTFDDGPDPLYTPILLDLLKKYKVKATFFVVGKHAEQHPEIVKRMNDEGHLIGIHNYTHRSNWIMRPKRVRWQIEKTADIIQDLTGERPIYYRPPWGIMNLFDFITSRRYLMILWSVMVKDWKVKTGAEKLLKEMKSSLRGGQIYLLHDCGRTFGADVDAPKNMIEALSLFLPEVEEKGYQSIRIDELMRMSNKKKKTETAFWKKIFVYFWLKWEAVYHFIFRLKSVNEQNRFLHYRITTYKGPELLMKDGQSLDDGDQVAEIHLDNKWLYEMSRKSRSSVQLAIRMIREIEASLPMLADKLKNHPKSAEIKALYGISMIHRGIDKFGFSVSKIPQGLFLSLSKFYLSVLMMVIHPEGKSRLSVRSEEMVPKIVTMPITLLTGKYSPTTSENREKVDEVDESVHAYS